MILHLGECLEVLRTMPDNSVDSVVTDPPYGLSFMGKKWDYDVPSVEVWAECLRVLKPGGHLLPFAGTRTQHRMAVRIEDAGFEIRDMIAWVYGSGFPKSLDVSKAIDKAAGVTFTESPAEGVGFMTPDAASWQGWGTALKPAMEPITVARKPLVGTVAENVLAHGCGGINVDGCRVGTETITQRLATVEGGKAIGGKAVGVKQKATGDTTTTIGRWPANLIHDGSEEVLAGFPQSNPGKPTDKPRGRRPGGFGNVGHEKGDGVPNGPQYGDTGSAARFFYCPKASKADRDEGCEGLEERGRNEVYGTGMNTATKCDPASGHTQESVEARPLRRNIHPTVKPTALMRYLCRLVTPPNGVVLDPFMGSGSTGKAAMLEGFQFIGIERDAEYIEIARARIKQPNQPNQPELFQS